MHCTVDSECTVNKCVGYCRFSAYFKINEVYCAVDLGRDELDSSVFEPIAELSKA